MRWGTGASQIPTNNDTDDTYTTETSSDEDALDDDFSVADDDESVASVEFIPCTPHDMPMLECRALKLPCTYYTHSKFVWLQFIGTVAEFTSYIGNTTRYI
jgi:hypothetical protein